MAEYERKRLENIKRNNEMMASLKIQSHLSHISSLTKRERPQSKLNPEKKQKSSSEQVVLRRSIRSQPPTSSGLKDDFDENQKHEPLSMLDAEGDDSESALPLIDLIKNLSKMPPISETQKGSVDLTALDLKPENVARVVPGSIMNVKFFPTADRTLLVVGNKFGNVGFWDVNAQEDDGYGIHLYTPHSAPVSGIVINPFSISKMYTSDYNGMIRLMDVEKEQFNFVYSGDVSIYSIAGQKHDSNTLYFSQGHKGFNIWDLRAGKSSSSWNLHEARINTIDFNSENTNLMVTSSIDGTACIWDLRKMNEGKYGYLKSIKHDKAVNSAYFSPSGKFLATTSIDDKVGISSGAEFDETCMVYHENYTRATGSPFRGIWGWDDLNVYIGNMERGVDVISVAEKRIITTLKSENMTAIPCRFDAHPYVVGMFATTTSGGTVYLWTSF